MKKIIVIAIVAVLSGCAHPQATLVIKNLDGHQRVNSFTPTRDLLIDPEGYPFVGVSTNQAVSRWQIHPDAPLGKVAMLTATLTEDERIELWTSQGIFIVGAPLYGGRRLPWFGTTDVEYRVKGNSISKNDKFWATAGSSKDSARRILADLAPQSNLGFVNLYFDFAPSSSWAEAESAICTVLPHLDGMRGLWLGVEKKGTVTLHFHDVWKKQWREDRTKP
ncbi:MAG: hypothetical protein E4H02_09995 [Lentisphaerales bacterium]|jgi:hypothetical protein|nr:MAG: hypothetical protein E4H02_09995 [Lentisphaerales bacterium]